MEIKFPKRLTGNYQTYAFFIDIANATKSEELKKITFNFEDTVVFESNLFAILGAIIQKLEKKSKYVKIVNLNEKISKLFNQKKLKHRKISVVKSLVKCWRLKSGLDSDLKEYLETKMFRKRENLELNAHMKMAIELCVAEIFRNAVSHSNSKDVFISYYYDTFKKRLHITLVSRGLSFKRHINYVSSNKFSGEDSLLWATRNNTSTLKEGGKGKGLFTIRQFIEQNEGKMQIISADGIWKQVKHRVFSKSHSSEFQGSIISLEFNI